MLWHTRRSAQRGLGAAAAMRCPTARRTAVLVVLLRHLRIAALRSSCGEHRCGRDRCMRTHTCAHWLTQRTGEVAQVRNECLDCRCARLHDSDVRWNTDIQRKRSIFGRRLQHECAWIAALHGSWMAAHACAGGRQQGGWADEACSAAADSAIGGSGVGCTQSHTRQAVAPHPMPHSRRSATRPAPIEPNAK